MDAKYLVKISEKINCSLKQVSNIHALHREGSTIPFIARYRKESTGNLDEVKINEVIEEVKYFEELIKRKETILKTIETLGKLTPELKNKIENNFDALELEDLYLPFKPKRKTRAVAAIEKGLEPLATLIFEQGQISAADEARKYISADVKDEKEALQGARDIIAEWISENESSRHTIREQFSQGAILHSRVVSSKKETEEAQKYRDYFDFTASLKNCPSHRVLAIRRGEKEDFLLMDIKIDGQRAIEALQKLFIRASNENAEEVKKAIEDGYDRLLKPAIENEFRVLSKTAADEDAIQVFTMNLRQLLLSAPLGSKRIMALDPGFRSGCKLVCLDAQGNLVFNTNIYPHPPQSQSEEAARELKYLVEKYAIEAIGIGNGTAGRETDHFVRSIDFGRTVNIFQVNESGASIYSASEVAREEFPDQDVTVRGAVSIGRRLLDPLSELVKIDAKSIGVGQYQHDVNQARLKESLDKMVESCVNYVGVDLNTASRHLLNYVSGLSSTLAKNIIEYRSKNGPFKSRAELKKVSLMGPKSFEQCAGFLRISNPENLLDNSAVHPESYHIVQEMARDLQCSTKDLVNQPALRSRIVKKKYVTEKVGEFTIEDILKELEKPGRDPREMIEVFRYDDSIKSIDDVKVGMTVPGIITNITKFGVFVDIGVKQDGLIHISQLSNQFVSDPNEVVKLQQRVMVTVTEVDVNRKRIGLSMKDQSKNVRQPEPGRPEQRTPHQKSKVVEKAESLNPFQSKLMEIKKKLK